MHKILDRTELGLVPLHTKHKCWAFTIFFSETVHTEIRFSLNFFFKTTNNILKSVWYGNGYDMLICQAATAIAATAVQVQDLLLPILTQHAAVSKSHMLLLHK